MNKIKLKPYQVDHLKDLEAGKETELAVKIDLPAGEMLKVCRVGEEVDSTCGPEGAFVIESIEDEGKAYTYQPVYPPEIDFDGENIEVTNVKAECLACILSRRIFQMGRPAESIEEIYDQKVLDFIASLPKNKRKLAFMTAPMKKKPEPSRTWMARMHEATEDDWFWIYTVRRIK